MFSSQNSQASSAVNYIDDVFSTWLYKGNGSTQSIANGINLSGKGGLTWIKSRSAADHALYDTARGATFDLVSNTTAAQTTQSTGLTAFNSNGFSLGALAKLNTNNVGYASWTFREQPKFFDVVTYTGNGVASRAISHNLGSAPGMMIVKRTDTVQNWPVYHRSVPTGTGYLNTTQQFFTGAGNGVWGDAAYNNIAPTSTVFYVGSDVEVNANGGTYVAYLFAHNAGGFGLTGMDNVISCGSYTGNGSTTNGPLINLGYEPQWLLIKNASAVYDWFLYDTMRGLTADLSTSGNPVLYPNLSAAQADFADIAINSTGFKIKNAAANPRINASGNTYIYMAIRRGPMKVPTLGTSVFSPVAYTGTSAVRSVTTNITSDLAIYSQRTKDVELNTTFEARLISPTKGLSSTSTAAEYTVSGDEAFGMVSNQIGSSDYNNRTGKTYINWSFSRAPGFFDVVCYTGTGVTRTVAHNLTVAPELMIVKKRSAAENWAVYSIALGTSGRIFLNSTQANDNGAAAFWNSTAPTTTVFTVGTGSTNDNTATYVNYLFATCPGVSKVGSYIGTGALQTVACGFTSGARFVLIKRTDSTGDWYIWDSARGISSGTDPHLLLNSTAAEVTANNYVDTDSTGFKVTAAAPAALNASGGTYIFLAIA